KPPPVSRPRLARPKAREPRARRGARRGALATSPRLARAQSRPTAARVGSDGRLDAIAADNGWRRRGEVGDEVAHGGLQRETGNAGALRHRGAAPGGRGRVGPEGGARWISITSEKRPAELVRAGRAHRRASRQRLGPPLDPDGGPARTARRRAGAR